MKTDDNSQSKRTFNKQHPANSHGGERRGFPKSRPASRSSEHREGGNDEERPHRSDRKPATPSGRGFSKERPRRNDGDRKPFGSRPKRTFNKERNFDKDNRNEENQQDTRPRRRDVTAESPILTEIVEKRRREGRFSPQKVKVRSLEYEDQIGPVRLNKYIANAGVCSRREADTLIAAGAITVNGKVVTEMGFKVMPTDEVRFGDKVLQREKPVYILLNKPKDYITTMEDEFNRKHVVQLIKGACKERVYPVGRLDRMTTGLLLFTNDGEMAKKLTHPRSGVRKIYHVTLDKNFKPSDMEQVANGIELDDGDIQVDEIAYVGDKKNEVGVTLHSGRNRIVRRIFESLDYQVEKLDRVVFAGLTKKDLPRGSWRFLTQAEINILKMSIKGEL